LVVETNTLLGKGVGDGERVGVGVGTGAVIDEGSGEPLSAVEGVWSGVDSSNVSDPSTRFEPGVDRTSVPGKGIDDEVLFTPTDPSSRFVVSSYMPVSVSTMYPSAGTPITSAMKTIRKPSHIIFLARGPLEFQI